MANFAAAAKAAANKQNTTVGPKGPTVTVKGEVTGDEIIIRIPRNFKDTDMRLTGEKPNKVSNPFVAFKVDLGDSYDIDVASADGTVVKVWTRRNINANLFCGWNPAKGGETESDE